MINHLEKNKVLLVYTPLIVYWLIILTATSLPGTSMPNVGMGDKVNHFLAYFGLGVLLYLTLIFQNKSNLLKNKPEISAFLISALYGIFDEVHQMFIPGRSCELYDFLADAVGAAAGIIVIKLIIKLNLNAETSGGGN